MSLLLFQFNADMYAQMKLSNYRNIAAHMFTWTNLPAGLDSDKLELMLIDRGSVSFFNTATGFYILPYQTNGQLNVYGDPTNAIAVPYNGIQLQQLDAIPRILWDNSDRQSFKLHLQNFAERVSEIQKSIAITERLARIPRIIKVNEANKESYARFESRIDEGSPVIYINEVMDTKAIEALDSGFSVDIFNALWTDYNKVDGEAFTMLGTMFNVEQNKAAGVGPAETVMNYSQTFAFANSRLAQRQRWCEKVNKEFALDIQCVKTEDFDDIIKQLMNGHPDMGNMQTDSGEKDNVQAE